MQFGQMSQRKGQQVELNFIFNDDKVIRLTVMADDVIMTGEERGWFCS